MMSKKDTASVRGCRSEIRKRGRFGDFQEYPTHVSILTFILQHLKTAKDNYDQSILNQLKLRERE